MDEFVWLRHPDTGGYFRCPVPAAEAWRARGWVDTDPPEETAAPTKDPEPDQGLESGVSAAGAADKPTSAMAETATRKPRGGPAASDTEKE